MTRILTGQQLAEESGVAVDLIDVLTEMRVVTPNRDGLYSAGDVIRVESVGAFLDAGMSLEILTEGIDRGLFTFEYLDRFYPEPAPLTDRSATELARELGVPADLLGSVYLAMGLPEPASQRPLRDDEVEIVRSFLEVWSPADPDAVLRAARLMGESARMASEGWTRLYVEKIADPMAAKGVPMDQRIQTIVETTEKATHLAPAMLTWLLQRHMRHSVDQSNIEGLEASMAEHGLVVPGPPDLPAIAFVDVSGYTFMTETFGDDIAVRTSELVRERGQEVVRRHGGSVVKILGDGAMLHFGRVGEAVTAALALVEALGAEGLPAHAGVHSGTVIQHDGDYYGRTVNLASRVAGEAGPGQVVVTKQVVDGAESDRFVFESIPPGTLKGIDQPVELYRAWLASGRRS